MLPPCPVILSFWGWLLGFLKGEVLPPTEVPSIKDRRPDHSDPGPEQPRGKFGPIRQAVERRIEDLVRLEIPEHRQIARQDVMELQCIEIECAPGGEELLQEFFRSFNPATRQSWIRDLIGGNRQVKLDCFAGVYGSKDLPNTGTWDRHAQILDRGTVPDFRVHLYAHWVREVAEIEPKPGGPRQQGYPLTLEIQDKDGPRRIQNDRYPLEVGRSGACCIGVKGTYVSGIHFVLHCDGRSLSLEDRSRNGTWIDGTKMPPGQAVELERDTYSLKLGKDQGPVGDYPEIRLEILRTPPAATLATPIAVSSPTPVAGSGGTPRAVLSIHSAAGTLLRDVPELPYTIGRETVAGANAGVSGEHLIIERITDTGAEVINRAVDKNGTALRGELQPERFFWPFDAEVRLAPRWRRDPEVRVVLQRPHRDPP